jgi:hypothetical protein
MLLREANALLSRSQQMSIPRLWLAAQNPRSILRTQRSCLPSRSRSSCSRGAGRDHPVALIRPDGNGMGSSRQTPLSVFIATSRNGVPSAPAAAEQLDLLVSEPALEPDATEPAPKRLLEPWIVVALVQQAQRERVRQGQRSHLACGCLRGEKVSALDRAVEASVCRALAGHRVCRWGDGLCPIVRGGRAGY